MGDKTFHIYKADQGLNEHYERMMTLYQTQSIDHALQVFTGNNLRQISRVHREEDGKSAWFNMQGFGFFVEEEPEQKKEEQVEKVVSEQITINQDGIKIEKFNDGEPDIGEYTDFGRVVKHLQVGQIIKSESGTELVKSERNKMKLIVHGTTSDNAYATIDTNYFNEQWAIVGKPVSFSEAVELIDDNEIYFFYKNNVYTSFTTLKNMTLAHLNVAKWLVKVDESLFYEELSEDEDDGNVLYIDSEDEEEVNLDEDDFLIDEY